MISIGILLITGLLLWILKVKRVRVPPKILRYCILAELIGVLITGGEWIKNHYFFEPVLSRPAVGDGDSEEELVVTYGEEKEEVKVHISERKMTDEEAEEIFAATVREIDAKILGKNTSLDEVKYPLSLKKSYQDGSVEAVWSSSDERLKNDGSIVWKEIGAPEVVYLTAELSLGEYESLYSFPVRLMPKSVTDEDGFSYYLSESLAESDEKEPEKESITLPETLEGIPLSWQGSVSRTGAEISVLALLGGVAMLLGELGEKRRRVQLRQQALSRDYPDIVSSLSLYVGAGLPVKAAFQRIADNYLKRRSEEVPAAKEEEEHPGFTCVLRTVRLMADGVGEMEAYREFGEAAGHKSYRKLSLLLTQNVKKGAAGLQAMLENEEREAFEMRKTQAKVRGEEASTKLLLPMLGLMLMMLVIMIVPALMGIDI